MYFTDALARPICHFLGYLYPAYQSYKAVQGNDTKAHTQWLTYWIVNTYFAIMELFGDTLLSWLPLYYETKIALLVWLVTPRFMGATRLYNRVIAPYLLYYEGDIDKHVDTLRQRSKQQIKDLSKEGIKHLRTRSTGFMKNAQDEIVKQVVDQVLYNKQDDNSSTRQ